MSRPPLQSRDFQTTHWSAVLAAGGDGTLARAALGSLCAAYWYPLYAFLRRSGHDKHDAEDLTQGFFAQLLSRAVLARIEPDRGRFRSFLLAALKNFVGHERERATAQKRGGGNAPIPFDVLLAEERYASEPADRLSPDRLFDQRWAVTLLERALERIRREFCVAGKETLFDALRPALTSDSAAVSYAEIGAPFAMNEGAVKTAVHRLRQRYRAALRAEIAETVEGPAQVDVELRHLFEALGT